MAGATVCYEYRPLKRPRLGPPDVYPQDPKQREDELTATSVKQGYNNQPNFSDEHGTARNCNIDTSKFGEAFAAILAEKQKLNTLQEPGRKKPPINAKDNFWPVTARSRSAINVWFQDLAGQKPLMALSKKVPIFNKKEEIFSFLCEYSVPLLRATWFVKMTSAYYVAISEAKIKKRQMNDPSQEWTQAMTRFLKEQLSKISEHYQQTPPPAGGSQSCSNLLGTNGPTMSQDTEQAMKLWQYNTRLTFYLFQEGLLDRQELLTWLLDLLDRTKSSDDSMLRLFLPMLLQDALLHLNHRYLAYPRPPRGPKSSGLLGQYVDDFVQSQQLSRRLAYTCAKKIAIMCSDSPCASAALNNQSSVGQGSANPVSAVYSEVQHCCHHRAVVLGLSCILQTVTLCCPTALVWNGVGESKSSAVTGSPLDILPCAPSSLPLPSGLASAANQIRSNIRAREDEIRQRGQAAEVKWSSDKCQQSRTGSTISAMLTVLEILDKHTFDRMDSNNSLDTLYNRIFGSSHGKNGAECSSNNDAIIDLLCEWGVTTKRAGEHRAMVVAYLLEKQQVEMETERLGEMETMDEKESISSASLSNNGLPPFQQLLMRFLDTKAPMLDNGEEISDEERQAFANLVLLFSELIRSEVFSHDAYMCTLISRGDLLHTPTDSEMVAPSPMPDGKGEQGHSKSEKSSSHLERLLQTDLESDLDQLDLLHPEVEPVDQEEEKETKMETEEDNSKSSAQRQEQNKSLRHIQYARNFPLPHDNSAHEHNQRLVLLYGVGKARDEAKHQVRKMTKEIQKGLNKLGGVEKKEESKSKKQSKSDTPVDLRGLKEKVQQLTYFDQHTVTHTCTHHILEMVSGFLAGTNAHLPPIEHITFVLDLMELALNIHGLLDFTIQLLTELSQVEAELMLKSSSLAGSYTTSLCLCIVAVLRRYHACLLVDQQRSVTVFEGLCSVVKHVGNPSDCSSPERCILAYLYDLYTSSSHLKQRFGDVFSSACSRVKNTVFVSIQPSASNLLWNPDFMLDIVENPRINILQQPRERLSLAKKLNEHPANRYSFVCNVLLIICNGQDINRINEISVLCSELTAFCNSLSSEWLGVLKALCCSSNHGCGFNDLLCSVDVGDLSIHDSLAVFTAILIARHCFSLEDFVKHVAIPALMAACPSAGGDQDAEPGARLTCHLLLHLFRRGSPEPVDAKKPGHRNIFHIRSSCDRHLLYAAHNSMSVGAVLAVLKAVLMLGDAGHTSGGPGNNTNSSGEISISSLFAPISGLDDLDLDLGGGSGSRGSGHLENASLHEYAKYCLRTICQQEWVQERCLHDPEGLCTAELLLDPMLSQQQAQNLLQLICYPEGMPGLLDDDDSGDKQKQVISQILQ
ncbi:Mediator of RNA polymerase II transcription subunit 12-like protein, partial [Branchiostoma belcheri]